MLKVGGIYTASNYIDIIVKITDEKIYMYYVNDVFNKNEMIEKKNKNEFTTQFNKSFFIC